jgi:Ni,Fe-hydrogenase III large subunit
MQIFRLRERVMDLLEGSSGNRVNYSMNRVGGVNRDLEPERVEAIRAGVREIREAVAATVIPLFTTDRTVAARCRGVGTLTLADAIAWGAVGPVARASGLDMDLRRDQRYLAYGDVEFAVPVQREGDVLARAVVRAGEIVESCKIVEQCLDRMPAGPLHVGDVFFVPAGEAVLRVEAPRGEVFYYLESNGTDKLARVKVRTPSFANIPTVSPMVLGGSLADVPLVQAAIDPCYSCTDR